MRCGTCDKELDGITSFSFWYRLLGSPKVDNYCEDCLTGEEKRDYIPEAGAACFECRETPVDHPDALKVGDNRVFVGPREFISHVSIFVCSLECANVRHKLIKKRYKSLRPGGRKIPNIARNRCNRCHEMGTGFKKCGGCGIIHYCSAECQKDDWAAGGHKLQCKRRR